MGMFLIALLGLAPLVAATVALVLELRYIKSQHS